jgi:MFS transporter, DHA1 family, inner membrane transport protein
MVTVTSTAEATTDAPQVGRPAHFWPAIIALMVGSFAIGTTEFVTMGALPQVAAGIDVSIPKAGHVISAYALGVVVGAPLLAYFGAKLPRRALLVGLMVAYAAFNALSALAPGYGALLVARFLDGLPHGGYFGVASLVAAGMVGPERRGRVIALVMSGLSVANVVGVPSATWLAQTAGWRAAYVVVAGLAALTVLLIALFVPATPGNPEATGRRELSALRSPLLWLTILAGAVGFGGMFALFSYIAPAVTEVGGLAESAVPIFLLVMGIGMVVGNWVAGILIDWSLRTTVLLSPLVLAVTLLLTWALVPYGWVALPAVFLVMLAGSGLALSLMIRLIDAAQHAETLGAATAHGALNIGNALGAWIGGVVISAGFGFRSPLMVGVVLSLLGLAVIALTLRVDRPQVESSSAVTS